ncbi:MAG TPA: thioredoxin family protein [Chitinispirillaceae bacterium]|nr:thioredoxin family protein [Chitinispirillaceae bacterium]
MHKLILSFFVFLLMTVYSLHASDSHVMDSSQLIADKIIKSEIPVLVDFWAQWCAPCRILNPLIEELEKDFKNKAMFIKVNVDINKALAKYFEITKIPEVFILSNKTVVRKISGVQPKEIYVKTLKEVIDSVSSLIPEKPDPI